MSKISFYTLGCRVNQYETQAIKEIFEKKGYEIVGENEFAHIYIVNSCSVTGISDRKTRQYIRKTKRLNPDAVTALIGCYAETGTDQVMEIDEVDIILGTAEKSKICDEIEDMIAVRNNRSKIVKVGGISELSTYDDYGIVNGMDSRTRAYIKIEDGCDRFCSYCIIPYARGSVRSRNTNSILEEARTLLKNGYRELILTGINAALYGSDTESSLISLIRKISDLSCEDDIPNDFRIRLSSLEPTVINADYARKLIEIPGLCPHLHLSLQSGSDRILSSMGRRYSRRDYLEIIDVLRNHDLNYSVTTDIIVGYPGETEDDFKQSLSIIKEAGFSKIHVFKYSKRKGTPAAEMMNQIPEMIKNERSRLLIEESEKEADAFLKRNKGTERDLLVLKYDAENQICSGITDNGIDVSIESPGCKPNEFLKIHL